ncbi:lysophospholipase L1-like esterase [Nocardia transvalensis]|uniref:Lysophospholipase L1-like esterase n=1 Tax=Nocardia transvalensis TaxID=37333 RepID=A0A7W9PJK2_9NOCA|nr:SGNH/GDSL hydrolase family protein [Nocardia transvalensis]MBB5916903.1 lysophospholipase L1-like esterase [Nocardia transvalensis]
MTSRLLGALAAILAVGLPCADAHAAPVPAGARYVALGSSYAAGPGLEPVADGPCARSARNYPHRVAEAANLDLVDVSCSGATTDDILYRPQTVAGTVMPPQIGAVTSYTRLVTVSVGGNDLNLIGSMLTGSGCEIVAGAVAGLCDGVTRTQPATPDDFDTVTRALADIVAAVRDRAPEATVLLVQYLPVLPSDGSTCAAAPMTPTQAAAARATYDGLIAATARAARESGAQIVSVADAENHTACTADPWVFDFQHPPRPADPTAAAGMYHPNPAGTSRIAEKIVGRLRD